MTHPIKIVICGNGLAANLTALALQENLSTNIQIELLRTGSQRNTDIFYGSTTAPDIYQFHLSLNVSEPDILLNTNSAFSFGSYFKNWGMTTQSWLQCFHLPFAVEKGVGLHHFITRQAKGDLQKYLINAQAALQGKFAHPPEEQQHPLSRAEYGYQFNPKEWSKYYATKLDSRRINIRSGEIEKVRVENEIITEIKLTNAEAIQATLFIDCSGPDAQLLTSLGIKQNSQRQLTALSSLKPSSLGSAYREINAFEFGWQAETPLRNGIERLTVSESSAQQQALECHQLEVSDICKVTLGQRTKAWAGNCVAIGQAANVIEPLTPAPSMMLTRDIQRLLELLPLSCEMSSEAREYNRRFKQDAEHTELFHSALFEFENSPNTAYWQNAKVATISNNQMRDKLQRKLKQFKHRGMLANFDLEPFNEQDWTILHFGMGRTPVTYDCLADQVSQLAMSEKLSKMQGIINQVVSKMPAHALYMENLFRFLKKSHP